MGKSQTTKLTAKQKRFVEEYAADGNAVQAYFRAFGRNTSKGKKRSYKGAQKQSSLLVSNPIIATEIEAANEEYHRKTRVSKQRVIREVAGIAFLDPDDVFESDPDNDGRPIVKQWKDIPPAARRAIAGLKVKRKRLVSPNDETTWEVEDIDVKFHSKDSALDKLCKRLGFYEDKGGDDKPNGGGIPVELLTRLLALAGAQQPVAGPTPGGTGGNVVGTEPRTAVEGVPE